MSILFVVVSPESALSNWHLKLLHSYLLHYNKCVVIWSHSLCLTFFLFLCSSNSKRTYYTSFAYRCPSMTSKLLGMLYMTNKYQDSWSNKKEIRHYLFISFEKSIISICLFRITYINLVKTLCLWSDVWWYILNVHMSSFPIYIISLL